MHGLHQRALGKRIHRQHNGGHSGQLAQVSAAQCGCQSNEQRQAQINAVVAGVYNQQAQGQQSGRQPRCERTAKIQKLCANAYQQHNAAHIRCIFLHANRVDRPNRHHAEQRHANAAQRVAHPQALQGAHHIAKGKRLPEILHGGEQKQRHAGRAQHHAKARDRDIKKRDQIGVVIVKDILRQIHSQLGAGVAGKAAREGDQPNRQPAQCKKQHGPQQRALCLYPPGQLFGRRKAKGKQNRQHCRQTPKKCQQRNKAARRADAQQNQLKFSRKHRLKSAIFFHAGANEEKQRKGYCQKDGKRAQPKLRLGKIKPAACEKEKRHQAAPVKPILAVGMAKAVQQGIQLVHCPHARRAGIRQNKEKPLHGKRAEQGRQKAEQVLSIRIGRSIHTDKKLLQWFSGRPVRASR